MGTAVAVAGLVLSTAGSVKQAKDQKKARKAADERQNRTDQLMLEKTEKENALRKKQADLATQKARIKGVREARIRRGAILAGAGNSGGLGSSALSGATSSISSQLGGEFAYGAAQRETSNEIGDLNVSTAGAISEVNRETGAQISKYSSSAATAGVIGGFGSQMFSDAGGFKTIFQIK